MCPLIGEPLYWDSSQSVIGIEETVGNLLPHIEAPVYHHRITCGIRLVCQCKIHRTARMEFPAETCPMENKGGVREHPSVMAAHGSSASGGKCGEHILAHGVIIDQRGRCNIMYPNHHSCLLGEIGAISPFQCHIHRVKSRSIRQMVGKYVH